MDSKFPKVATLFVVILVGLFAIASQHKPANPNRVVCETYSYGLGYASISAPPNDQALEEFAADCLNLLELKAGQWSALGIDSYVIHVRTDSVWFNQFYELTVEDGNVTRHVVYCEPVQFRPDCGIFDLLDNEIPAYTVGNLFSIAQRKLIYEPDCFAWIDFNSQYSFPSSIGYDCVSGLDEERGWHVILFQELP